MDEQCCIQVNSLTKSFSGRKVVNNLSFEVNKGEVFALIGHNGAGKSTAIDLILGLKSPDGGNTEILGMDAAKNRKTIFEKVGVQLQHTEYQSRMTVEEACIEYASLYRNPSDYEDLLHMFGLSDLKKSYISRLSGGEKQKLSTYHYLLHHTFHVLHTFSSNHSHRNVFQKSLNLRNRWLS